jgi:hypothetical protein
MGGKMSDAEHGHACGAGGVLNFVLIVSQNEP